MKKIFLLSILAIFYIKATAQITWEKLYLPYESRIFDMVVNDKGHIFIATAPSESYKDTTIVYKSIDNCKTWDKVHAMRNSATLGMEINNKQEIFLFNNQFWKSDSTGTIWKEFKLNNVESIYSRVNCIGGDSLLILSSASDDFSILMLRTFDLGLNLDTLFLLPKMSTIIPSGVDIFPPNDIYFSLMDFPMMGMNGGVFHSKDNGLTWEEIGLKDQQVTSISINNNGDLFASSWQSLAPNTSMSGVFALYNGNDVVVQCFSYASTTSLAINSTGYVFASFAHYPHTFPIYVSTDNGRTFVPCSEMINGISKLYCDKSDYIYALPEQNENFIYRTTKSTASNSNNYQKNYKLKVYPNISNSKITIEFPDKLKTTKNYHLIINDINGKTIYRSKNIHINGNTLTVDISDYTKGLYIIEMYVGSDIYFEKIIKY